MIAVAATVALVGGIFAWREYSRGHQDTSSVTPVHTLSANALLQAFQQDEAAAMATYVGASEQVVQEDGTIAAMENDGTGRVNVVLATDDPMAGVVCEFQEQDVPSNWRAGAEVSIKGICTGMLMDVVLVRCVPA